MNKILTASAVLLLSMPLFAQAQNAPQAGGVVATAPGQAVAAEAVQLQGKIKSIDKKNKSVVVVGAQGNEIVMQLGEEARNFKQIRVGDLVTLTYAQALVLELRKTDQKVEVKRTDSEEAVRTKKGEKPGGAVQHTVNVIADVVGVNTKARTVTLRGPKRTVELAVNDPEQLKAIKVGDQVEVVYTEAVALEVTAAKKK